MVYLNDLVDHSKEKIESTLLISRFYVQYICIESYHVHLVPKLLDVVFLHLLLRWVAHKILVTEVYTSHVLLYWTMMEGFCFLPQCV